jgi:hypothetical protein
VGIGQGPIRGWAAEGVAHGLGAAVGTQGVEVEGGEVDASAFTGLDDQHVACGSGAGGRRFRY